MAVFKDCHQRLPKVLLKLWRVCGGVLVVVFLWWCFLWWCWFLWWCGGVFVVVWCFCGGGVVFCGGVVVFLWWCGVFVVLFLWWCGGEDRHQRLPKVLLK